MSLTYVAINTVISVTIALPAAYAFNRYRFVGDKHLFFWLLTNLMAPASVYAMPFFNLYYALHLFDTMWAVALAHCLFNVPLAVWILEGFIGGVPREIDEMAAIDGYSFPRFFIRIFLPLIANGVGVTAFFCFMFSWVEQLLATTLTATNALPFAAVMTRSYSVSGIAGMDFLEAGPVPGQGHIAQQIFWYSAFTAALSKPDLPVMNKDGTPKWRMAPSPHGAYWKEGMKLGYQDVGCWTMLKYAEPERVKAGWLYAQFCVSKTVSLKKSVTFLHVIRESDIWHQAMTDLAPKVGGWVEFYRSPARKLWTPTGVNVPEYGKLAQVWWQNVSKGISGEVTPQEAMDGLAKAQDAIMARVEKSGVQGKLGPKLNEEKDPEYWYAKAEKDGTLAPQRKLANEKPQGVTVDYDELLKTWQAQAPKKG